jgi:competence protein ComEC
MGGGPHSSGISERPIESKKEVEERKEEIRRKTIDQLKQVKKENRIKEMIASSNPDEIGIVYLNAGQGDATIVRLPNGKVMVIDCNTDESPENIVEYLKKAGIEKIDYLVITHPHADHMSGTKEIADHFEVGEVWTTDYTRHKYDTPPESYEKYKEAYVAGISKMERKGTEIKTPTAKNEPIVKDGKLEVRILGPSKSVQGDNEDIHEESLALQIKFGKTSFVFTGDTTNEQQDRISEYYPVKGTTIWHASHHGSVDGANEEVMKKVKPKYTVIPVGENNVHQHPHEDALRIYEQHTQKKVYRTDQGNVGFRFNADGESLEVQD